MPPVPIPSPPLVRLQGINKAYQEGNRHFPILRDLQGEFNMGELTAVIGRSGSGKTTLLNIISGIDNADGGEVFVGNSRVSHLNDDQRTRFRRVHIGFVFQFFNLVPTLTVFENVCFPLELNRKAHQEGRNRAMALLDRVGLADRTQAFPDRLSGGERQRVAIARALVHDPMLLLADEPTGNLDQETGQSVLTLMTELVRERGQCLIMVTHSMAFANQADRILTLHQGTLVAEIQSGSL